MPAETSHDSIWAIVPAAGRGSRMQSATPKQYLALAGRPVIVAVSDASLTTVER